MALLLTPQPQVLAQSNQSGCQANLYELSKIADTQRLTESDILNGEVEQLNIDYKKETLATNSPYKASATIDVPRYWQMRVNNSDLPINTSDVQYTLISSNESNNPFKQNKFTPKVFGDIEQLETCSDNTTTVITSGISLEFTELSELVPGTFEGQIDICVQVNGNQCQ